MRILLAACLLLFGFVLIGCRAHGDPTRPIPTQTIAAKSAASRLVVLLPGRADDLAALRASGATEAIQTAWPDAEVVLAELTLDYYKAGAAERRLHEEIILPAQQRGLREVWLVGASLGGMGALLYDRAHPGVARGLVLLAPYLGDDALLSEIHGAGGVAAWQPGPQREVGPGTWQRELWRNVWRWTREPSQMPEVWLAYGRKDGFSENMPLLAGALPNGHTLEREGGHTWRVWTPAVAEILATRERNGTP